MSSYQDEQIARSYLEFVNSRHGQQEQALVFDLFSQAINFGRPISILDAGCGTGWLIHKLKQLHPNVTAAGFDLSSGLIAEGKRLYPDLDLRVGDMSAPLPYEPETFDVVVSNFALHAVRDVGSAYQQLCRVLKKQGSLLITIPNPYYAYPVGRWQRSWRKLFGLKPVLKLRPYYDFRPGQEFSWQGKFTSYFYPLAEHVRVAGQAGLQLRGMADLTAPADSPDFDLHYQLYRYPTALFLEFSKV